MAEAFLLLLGAGVMLGVAVPNPRDVTLNWMRLGGIIALAMEKLRRAPAQNAPKPREVTRDVTARGFAGVGPILLATCSRAWARLGPLGMESQGTAFPD